MKERWKRKRKNIPAPGGIQTMSFQPSTTAKQPLSRNQMGRPQIEQALKENHKIKNPLSNCVIRTQFKAVSDWCNWVQQLSKAFLYTSQLRFIQSEGINLFYRTLTRHRKRVKSVFLTRKQRFLSRSPERKKNRWRTSASVSCPMGQKNSFSD